MVNAGRHTASFDGDFVVFLIGARVHKLWKVRQWLPVAKAMTAMQREITAHPEMLVTSAETQARLEAHFGPLEPVETPPGDPARVWRIAGGTAERVPVRILKRSDIAVLVDVLDKELQQLTQALRAYCD